MESIIHFHYVNQIKSEKTCHRNTTAEINHLRYNFRYPMLSLCGHGAQNCIRPKTAEEITRERISRTIKAFEHCTRVVGPPLMGADGV